MSVPAIWSDRARDKTLDCAYRAGYGRRFSPEAIKLVTEPEAAASYTITTVRIAELTEFGTLKAYTGQQPTQAFKNGDAFVVCDAGGGTVVRAKHSLRQYQC